MDDLMPDTESLGEFLMNNRLSLKIEPDYEKGGFWCIFRQDDSKNTTSTITLSHYFVKMKDKDKDKENQNENNN